MWIAIISGVLGICVIGALVFAFYRLGASRAAEKDEQHDLAVAKRQAEIMAQERSPQSVEDDLRNGRF